MRIAFVTLVYCPACGTWHSKESEHITWREQLFWCSQHPEPVCCTGTTSFLRIDFGEAESC